jgi:alanine racemase
MNRKETFDCEIRVSELPEITGGHWIHFGGEDAFVGELITDTRVPGVIHEGVFFALQGQRDGHDFLNDALLRGIKTLIVSRTIHVEGRVNVLLVQNTLLALQQLAAFKRKKYEGRVVAVTGSNGKTTLKEWTWQILFHHFKTFKSPGSFNSQFGVPLSVWGIDNRYKIALIEAGISRPNEMQTLAEVIYPDWVLFTAMGDAHSENFIGMEDKIAEKAKLAKGANRCFLSADQPEWFEIWKKNLPSSVTLSTYGTAASAHCRVYRNASGKIVWSIPSGEFEIPFFSSSAQDLHNVAGALAIAMETGLKPEEILPAIEPLRPIRMRLEIRSGYPSRTIISDVWSNDEASMKRALEHLIPYASRGPLFVLCSPFAQSIKSVNDLLEYGINQYGIHVWGIGASFKALEIQFPSQVKCFQTLNEMLIASDALPSNAVVLVKGARKYAMEQLSEHLSSKHNATALTINLPAIINNFRYFQNKMPTKKAWMIMLKAAGYGSGELETALVLQRYGVDYFAVANAEEGIRLRKGGITISILILNPVVSDFKRMVEYRLEPALYSMSILKKWLAFPENYVQVPCHLKWNTGMNRLGLNPENILEVSECLAAASGVKVASVYSHLSASENPSADEFTREQIRLFKQMVESLKSVLDYSFHTHISNSAGIQRFKDLPFSMVRLGIGLYGIAGSPEDKPYMEPVLEWQASILQIRKVNRGERIGYGFPEPIPKDLIVGIVGVGYADGFPRNLGEGRGGMRVSNQWCPTLGSVCMDLTLIDLTNVPEAREGDMAEIFGKHVGVEDVAQRAQTIPYEIMTGIGKRIPRVFITE